MSVSLEILNNNNSYRTTTAATAKSVKAAESKSVSIPVEENAENSVPNVDSFVHGGGSAKYGAYSKTIAMKNNSAEAAPAASKVQAKGAGNTNLTSGSNSYIAQKQKSIAQKYHVRLNGSRQPIVNGQTDAINANKYLAELCSPKKINYNKSYVVNQLTPNTSYYGNCARTSCEMMAKINSKGQYGYSGNIMSLGGYTRKDDAKASDYNPNKKGYFNYKGLTKEELSNIIASEIDHGRSVELHTSYKNGEHWVTVTGYKLDSTGNIKLTTENNHDYITGLSGIDPYPNKWGNEQETDDLGKNASVATSGQWLNTSTGGYQVFTFNP